MYTFATAWVVDSSGRQLRCLPFFIKITGGVAFEQASNEFKETRI